LIDIYLQLSIIFSLYVPKKSHFPRIMANSNAPGNPEALLLCIKGFTGSFQQPYYYNFNLLA